MTGVKGCLGGLVRLITTLKDANSVLGAEEPLNGQVFIGLNLTGRDLSGRCFEGVVFLGCQMDAEVVSCVVLNGGLVFPRIDGLPYEAYRRELYKPEELFNGFKGADTCTYCHSLDGKIYKHYIESGRDQPHSVVEALARRLHDLSLVEAMNRFLREQDQPVVGIMGGHSMSRTSAAYEDVVHLCRSLAQRGYLLISGGGPGAMEACHLGAWLCDHSESTVQQCLEILKKAPTYQHKDWLKAAFEVRELAPFSSKSRVSLGIPTFLYGHEPPNPFATHIAKFFANSVREEGIVTIATHGLVFAPGSAGTVQEIFQDACQNHYGTVDGLISPMVFLGTTFWTESTPVFPLLKKLAKDRDYSRLLYVSDDIEEVANFLEDNQPFRSHGLSWSYCAAHCS